MEQFDKEYFKKLANQIMFDLSDQEIHELQDEFKVLLSQMDYLDKINTDGVEEMVYPFEDETSFIREDEVDQVLSVNDALSNVMSVKEGYVHVPKAVK
ncbi:MAG: Asp-tRNA(Asn)/Glu-tRNA(Gln) amidotransferase subunit GatC [Erysipelotrichaceae bacterium]